MRSKEFSEENSSLNERNLKESLLTLGVSETQGLGEIFSTGLGMEEELSSMPTADPPIPTADPLMPTAELPTPSVELLMPIAECRMPIDECRMPFADSFIQLD